MEAASPNNTTPACDDHSGGEPLSATYQNVRSVAAAAQQSKDAGGSRTEKIKQNDIERREEMPTAINRIPKPLVTRSTLEIVIPDHAVPKLVTKSKNKLAQISELSGANVTLVEDRPEVTEKIIQISGTPEQVERAQSLLQGFILSKTELLQVSNLQQKLRKTLWHAASHQQQVGKRSQYFEQSTQNRKVGGKGNYSSEETQLYKAHANEENNSSGENNHLLILAHSAELMLESDSLDGTHRNDRNLEGFQITPMAQHLSESVCDVTVKDHKSAGKQVEGTPVTPVIDHVRTEKDGFNWGGRTPRLSQIRHQARSKSNLLLQQRIGEPTVGHLQVGRIRLSQILHQARSKYHSQRHSCGDSQGRIVRLSEMRRQARSKCNSLVQEAIEDQVLGHLDSQTCKDNQRKRIIADIFGEEDGSKAADADGFTINRTVNVAS
ncbi:hypothetical protein GH714_036075 [Hevea brasiliensis]|uniref:K Homology domain-containing protein n=1 Tax=Hevea brasiliensis TaxID=3981 RepID=A0A6A6KVC5_HEVBR|nr:hypothetical protein GH714_036075 [Hevea brasiliensis]